MKIILTPPNADTPGFNKRAYQAAKFEDAFEKNKMTPDLYKEMCEFLAEFIEVEFAEGEKPLSKFEALWEQASENQMKALMSAVSGGSAPEVPPEKSES
jgi:hypothetical protein